MAKSSPTEIPPPSPSSFFFFAITNGIDLAVIIICWGFGKKRPLYSVHVQSVISGISMRCTGFSVQWYDVSINSRISRTKTTIWIRNNLPARWCWREAIFFLVKKLLHEKLLHLCVQVSLLLKRPSQPLPCSLYYRSTYIIARRGDGCFSRSRFQYFNDCGETFTIFWEELPSSSSSWFSVPCFFHHLKARRTSLLVGWWVLSCMRAPLISSEKKKFPSRISFADRQTGTKFPLLFLPFCVWQKMRPTKRNFTASSIFSRLTAAAAVA